MPIPCLSLLLELVTKEMLVQLVPQVQLALLVLLGLAVQLA
jgi:hypothetical protein